MESSSIPPLLQQEHAEAYFMVALENYVGREQAYVKHVFLERYLEALAHKVAKTFDHVVYVDGFAGPWQSSSEKFEDTSFGIALKQLQRAAVSWGRYGRNVRMSAYLVEKDAAAYRRLSTVPASFQDVEIKTYHSGFIEAVPQILKEIPRDAFAFFFIDPKAWGIPMEKLRALLSRKNSEVVFNFMFDFINRAASIAQPNVARRLDELLPFGNFRENLAAAEKDAALTPDQRKDILVGAFRETLQQLGGYGYVLEATVLRPVKDRPLYCLVYGTRSVAGVEVFRECQIKAMTDQSKVRASTKLATASKKSGQTELFDSMHDMAPDDLSIDMETELAAAAPALLEFIPIAPKYIRYEVARANVLARHMVKPADVNKIAAKLRADGKLNFLDWEPGKRVPGPKYRVQRR